MFPVEAMRQPGEFEAAAMKRERDALWRERYHLNQEQGRRLDFLVGQIGRPEEPLNQIKNPDWFVKAGSRQGFESFNYTERS